MVVGENKHAAAANIMDGIENTGDVRMHDHRLRLKQRFDIVRKLGQGTYGKVQLGINKKTGQEVAIKTIKKCKIESEADLVRIRREVQIMSSVRHPNIVHIYEVFENSEKMILVMEYCPGGELYDYLSQKKVLQEEEARRLFRQIATATYYCHIHKICHRDLKLENVLLDDTGSAKIADFGLSNVFKETSLLSTFCGSPLYASPEIVKGTPYIGPEVDCWSLGVLLYTLVYGAMPFDGSNFKRLVRQISNGDYYEPRNPSSASPLIRDMLTVDPLKRADIAYICDHPWVNSGYSASCLEVAEALAAETPVRLDLLLSLAPAAAASAVVVPPERELGPEESATDLTSSTSMAVEPSNSAEKRILDLVAEGGEDAIKPSPTRTLVSAGDNKRKLEQARSASGLQRKKERVPSVASMGPQSPPLPEEASPEAPPTEPLADDMPTPCLKSSATMTIAPAELARDATKDVVKENDEPVEKAAPKPRAAVKKRSPTKVLEKSPEKEVPKQEEAKVSSVSAAADKLTSLALAGVPERNTAANKPKKLSIPGGNVGSFKDQFERRASLTAAPEIKRNVVKPVVSKIAKPKAASEDREIKPEIGNGTVRLQQIGIEPSPTPPCEPEPVRGGVKKTESEPNHAASPPDPAVLLQDARRSLQNSMAKLVEEKQGEDSRRRAARDIISSAIRTGKPPMPYSRSSSAGVGSLSSPGVGSLSSPGVGSLSSPPATPLTPTPRLFRTEAHHKVQDHRPNSRGVSVERIIPISVTEEVPAQTPLSPAQTPLSPAQSPLSPAQKPAPRAPLAQSLRRLVSTESGSTSEGCSSPGEPIKKSAREFIIPIAVEGGGYVTPRQRSLEPEAAPKPRPRPQRRISNLVSGGESEEEDDNHMHRLRPSRLARADSASSGEEDEEDEGFHLLTAENLFSTLLHRVRALTNRLNGEEGPGFPQHPHSLFNNLQAPFFTNSPHLPRRHLLRDGWGSRDLHADFDSMFNKSRAAPRGSSGATSGAGSEAGSGAAGAEPGGALDLADLELSEREVRALSGLTPALSRRLRRQLLACLPPPAAQRLRRTLSLHAPAPAEPDAAVATLPRRRDRLEHDAERPLLSKYLTPERALSLDSSAPEQEPAVAAPPPERRHSQSPRRASRFLRPDFFERAAAVDDESAYLRHRKEKEQETQRILREIRARRAAGGGRALDTPPPERASPLAALLGRERERSATPFLPSVEEARDEGCKLRPRSYPVPDAPRPDAAAPPAERPESRLLRPRSYPATSPHPDKCAPKEDKAPATADVEVSFSITLPRKKTTDAPKKELQEIAEKTNDAKPNGTLVLRKYQVVNGTSADKPEAEHKARNGVVTNGAVAEAAKTKDEIAKPNLIKKDETKKIGDTESEKKGTVKKKIIKKVSSKSKTDLASVAYAGDVKTVKKITKKVKDKADDDTAKTTGVPKKKSVLQSIGHKLEKFASSKSASPEKNEIGEAKRSSSKVRGAQREAAPEPPGEARLIARAVTDSALDQPANKTTVSKVLGLFKKFEPKDKIKPIMEKSLSVDTADLNATIERKTEIDNDDKEKIRRPTSLLLNGLGRKKYDRTCSDSVTDLPAPDEHVIKKENETKNKNNLRLDFSKLPRVKKIVPTNSVIEPQINYSSLDGEGEKKYISEKIALALDKSNGDRITPSRSRSRSRSTVSNEVKSDLSADGKQPDRTPSEGAPYPLRSLEPTSPEEDIVDRIRRKSFYSRFNEKKQRRKSSLVGPGAAEYDPLARILAPPSPDPAPTAEPHRPLADLKYENYGLNDKIDTYRSLDRNDYRKYPTRSYLDYEPTYNSRYSRTKSLLEPEGTEALAALREPLRYNRTISMYSPGNYATYRPKRTHNPAIILKESEKEPSPENILDKIKQRKNFSISVTRKPDRDSQSASRSPVPSKGEGDGTECSEKVD